MTKIQSTLLEAPKFMKFSISDALCGRIIGKSGNEIKTLMTRIGCVMQISHSTCRFPFTNERVLLAGGSVESLQRLTSELCDMACRLKKFRSSVCRFILGPSNTLPNFFTSTELVSELSDVLPSTGERVLSFSGKLNDVKCAALTVFQTISALDNKDLVHFDYSGVGSSNCSNTTAANMNSFSSVLSAESNGSYGNHYNQRLPVAGFGQMPTAPFPFPPYAFNGHANMTPPMGSSLTSSAGSNIQSSMGSVMNNGYCNMSPHVLQQPHFVNNQHLFFNDQQTAPPTYMPSNPVSHQYAPYYYNAFA